MSEQSEQFKELVKAVKKIMPPEDMAVLLADECAVRPGQVKLLLGCGETMANCLRKRDDFPKMQPMKGPWKDGEREVDAYLKSEIVAWLRDRFHGSGLRMVS